MADFVSTITESVTLNGVVRGITRTNTISNITDVYERVITCLTGATTTVATFASDKAAAALDTELVKYIRITNLHTTADIKVAMVGASTNTTHFVAFGTSLMLSVAEDAIVGEEDASPGWATADLASIQVYNTSGSDVQVEVFIASL